MWNKEKEEVKKTVKILTKLDKKSLLIIQSGAGMLLARQELEEKEKAEREAKE